MCNVLIERSHLIGNQNKTVSDFKRDFLWPLIEISFEIPMTIPFIHLIGNLQFEVIPSHHRIVNNRINFQCINVHLILIKTHS